MIKIEAQEVREAGPPVLLHEVHANGASAVSSEAKTAALRMKRGGFPVMMQKIQRFGGAMYTPAILFAFSGIVVGLGTLFTTEAIFGEMATAGHFGLIAGMCCSRVVGRSLTRCRCCFA